LAVFVGTRGIIHRYNALMPDLNNKLYTAAQVRGLDYAAIHEFGIAGYELMCRAGRVVVDAACEQYPEKSRWLILCGPGNNGGDGYVVARLASVSGIEVTVCSLTATTGLKGDAATACDDWIAHGGEVLTWPLAADVEFDLAFDCLLGTGIEREISGEFRQAIEFLNRHESCTISVDIPSGLNADTGRVMGVAISAQSTVTFVGKKRGMYTASGPDCCGRISFDDLAIPDAVDQFLPDSGGPVGSLLHAGQLLRFHKPRQRNSHKGKFGHVVAVGGINGMSGAIRLCGEAALRSGAGRVTLATDTAHSSTVNIARPELMVSGVSSDSELEHILNRDQTIVVGPGLGQTTWSEALLHVCLNAGTSLLVDADALNLLALSTNRPERQNWILTPHPAEASRLLNCSVADIQNDRITAAQTIASQFNATTILKGCGTVVAEPSGEYAICPFGNPGMATAGSGDVLSGIVGALMAQGLSCAEAACCGVVAHAMAGDIAARNIGEMAMLAGDISDCLHFVWRDLSGSPGQGRQE
jgi:hydroxyethylthiazole kinase-like uncharacterized protein yjeF